MSGESFGIPTSPEPDRDVWSEPQTKRYLRRMATEVLPELRRSAVAVSVLSPGALSDMDVQQATEIGATLLMGKPLILCVTPGTQVPDGLAAAAVAILELGEGGISPERIGEALRAAGLDR